MELKKIRPGVYALDADPRVTVEKWRATNTYWDVFFEGSVSQKFGTFETLADVKEELKSYTVDSLLKTF